MNPRPILLAEDNEDDVFFMLRAAKASGITHPIHVAPHGRAVVDYLDGAGEFADREKHPLPFLVFLDLKMPHKSGLEVLEWIRQQFSLQTMLVLVLTTSREESDVQRAYRLGANSFLVKPPNASQLTELMRLVRAYWIENPQLAVSPPTIDVFAR
ncbi:MAG TPA: response regulator [Opitutaceae bacterium]|nr:response regulator [Opitutaceae bacterium]